MAWLTMLLSIFVALSALLLCSSSFVFTDASALKILDRIRSLSISQHVIGTHGSLANGSLAAMEKEWNVMYHMGGNSPWIPKLRGTFDGGVEPPTECRIEQVHMMSRHAERFPTFSAGLRMLELYQRIQHANITLHDDMAFANEWDFFMKDPGARLENLVTTGPYAGTLEAFATGVKLRTRYEHLLEKAIPRNQTSFWASDSKRVVETAEYFAAGFFGLDWTSMADLFVMSETESLGGDTLTPGKTCFKYLHNADPYGRMYGIRMFDQWRSTYLPPIMERLAKQNPELLFTEAEVYSMQELCGFETIAKGSSLWCDVFTHEELRHFEYARDLLHFYRTGPGNPYSATMGWLWLNATADLLRQGPEAGPLFFSFVHDGDLIPLLSALDLFPPTPAELPTTHVLHNRTWRSSDIVPMGGRIIFERLACRSEQKCWNRGEYGYPNHVYCEPLHDDHFVRINVNDGIVALPGCDTGPGMSCPIEDFLSRTKKRGEEVGDFRKVCGLPKSAAEGITFLHQ